MQIQNRNDYMIDKDTNSYCKRDTHIPLLSCLMSYDYLIVFTVYQPFKCHLKPDNGFRL